MHMFLEKYHPYNLAAPNQMLHWESFFIILQTDKGMSWCLDVGSISIIAGPVLQCLRMDRRGVKITFLASSKPSAAGQGLKQRRSISSYFELQVISKLSMEDHDVYL